MKVAVIYGTEHKGSTYNITQLFLKDLAIENKDVKEFFLPKDMPHFCIGCGNCFTKSEKFCPHYEEVNKISEAILNSDLLIFSSPVYVYHTTGQMKTLLDHFGYQWIVHRPDKKMFNKMALVISTAAGAGMKSTNKDIGDSLSFWGVARIFKYGKGVAAINWEGVSEKNKQTIEKDLGKIAAKISNTYTHVTPSIGVKIKFYIMRFVQKKIGFSEVDVKYWKDQGWLEKVRPW
nr:NAD(P)H-dependent oxidoreductase [Sedimentibacter sp.]